MLSRYTEITPHVKLSGPTNFGPLIREAIGIVRQTREYHMLVIIADGQVTEEKDTVDAIVEASNYPLSIVLIGVRGVVSTSRARPVTLTLVRSPLLFTHRLGMAHGRRWRSLMTACPKDDSIISSASRR